jgi:hypothetical protein
MAARTLIALAEFSLQFGFIGIDEYVERCEVALWLDDESGTRPDPRGTSHLAILEIVQSLFITTSFPSASLP